MFTNFYYGTIRKYVVAFGTLFNNIYISKKDQNGEVTKYRIPLSYAEKDKFVRRLDEYPTLTVDENTSGIGYSYYPRMSFQLTNITYDGSRKRNTLARVFKPTTSALSTSYVYSETPYDLSFTLNIRTRRMEDGLQIIEQILPFFCPEFYVSMDLTDFAKKIDIPIVLESYTQNIEYESDFDDTTENRIVTFELVFTMKGFLFGPKKSGDIVRESIMAFFSFDNEYRIESAKIGVSGGTGASAAKLENSLQIFGGTASDADIFG